MQFLIREQCNSLGCFLANVSLNHNSGEVYITGKSTLPCTITLVDITSVAFKEQATH